MRLSEHTFTPCNNEVSRYIVNPKYNLSRYIGFVNHQFYVEHYEEEEISPNSVQFEVGGGALKTPTIVASKTMPVLAGESKEQTVEWDVTSAIDTAAKANDLKVVVRNKGTNGKKIKIDRVYVVVTYSGGTSTSAPTSTP